jgi:type II secretory pathway component PulF
MTEWIFEYKALLTPYTSSITSGTINAVSADEARKKLIQQGWQPVSVHAIKPAPPQEEVENV